MKIGTTGGDVVRSWPSRGFVAATVWAFCSSMPRRNFGTYRSTRGDRTQLYSITIRHYGIIYQSLGRTPGKYWNSLGAILARGPGHFFQYRRLSTVLRPYLANMSRSRWVTIVPAKTPREIPVDPSWNPGRRSTPAPQPAGDGVDDGRRQCGTELFSAVTRSQTSVVFEAPTISGPIGKVIS